MESPFAHLTSELGGATFFEVQEKSCRVCLTYIHYPLCTTYSYDDSDDTNVDEDKGDSRILLYEFGPKVPPPLPSFRQKDCDDENEIEAVTI